MDYIIILLYIGYLVFGFNGISPTLNWALLLLPFLYFSVWPMG
nr:MAG TPA: hypothetical protein [Caudoviricetes sp.]